MAKAATRSSKKKEPVAKVTKKRGMQCNLKFHLREDGHAELKFDQDIDCNFGTLDPDQLQFMIKQIRHLAYNGSNETKEDKEAEIQRLNSGLAFIANVDPQDIVESSLAIQMFAVHTLAMTLASRAVMKEQVVEHESHNLNRLSKLMRTFTAQMEALNKYRTKGQQKITVQHVNVENGGQAIVGDVNQGGGNG